MKINYLNILIWIVAIPVIGAVIPALGLPSLMGLPAGFILGWVCPLVEVK